MLDKTNKKYYHDAYFEKIISLYNEGRLEQVLIEFDKYFETYPLDSCGKIYYADTFIKLNRLDEAEKILDSINPIELRPLSFEEYKLIKIKLYCCLEKYREALDLLEENRMLFIERGWSYRALLLLFSKRLGLPVSLKLEDESYLNNQVYEYSEKRALEHIDKHSYGNDEGCEFQENFPLQDIYFQVRSMLPTENRINNSILNDNYIFKYDNCGRADGKLVDYFKVVVITNSNDIITMYPYMNKERASFIDLTPELKVDKLKCKRLSQIEKFNQRYNVQKNS